MRIYVFGVILYCMHVVDEIKTRIFYNKIIYEKLNYIIITIIVINN